MENTNLSLIVSIIIAVVAIVPGIWALVNQAKKDASQARMDMNKAANDAAMSIIGPLQMEVTRLQSRVLELEKLLVEKTSEIGDLMQSNIDKDSEIRTLKYSMSDMQLRLSAFEKKKNKSKDADETDLSAKTEFKLEEELKANEVKKEEVRQYTIKSIENINNGSIVNTNNTEMEE